MSSGESQPAPAGSRYWETFAREVAPRVMSRHSPNADDIRVWVAGCGDGAVAYVVAAALLLAGERAHHRGHLRVIASDTDASAILEARTSSVAVDALRSLPRDLWHAPAGDSEGEWTRVHERLRRHILFNRHVLGVDPPFGRCDLVYVTEHARIQSDRSGFAEHLAFAVRDNGLIFATGEPLTLDANTFELIRGRLYRKSTAHVHRQQLDEIITDVIDAERLRISADLHDGVGQSVAAVSLLLHRLRQTVGATSPAFDAVYEDVIEAITALRQELRAMARGELSLDVYGTNLPSVLADAVANIASTGGVEAKTTCSGSYDWLDSLTATHLVRIAQEALRNAISSQAKLVEVSLRQSDHLLQLAIQDNGPGLPGLPGLPGSGPSAGVGLRIMRHRAQAMHGRLRFWSDEHGTRIVCEIDRA